MKKILSILALALAPVAISAQDPQPLAPIAERLNQKCPTEISEGMTMTSAQVADDAFVFVYTISADLFDNIAELGGILHDSLVAELASSPDPLMRQLIAACKATGYNVIERFNNPEGKSFDIVIKPEEF